MDDEGLLIAARGDIAAQGTVATEEVKDPPAWLEDLRLFALGWMGGLVFFGTLFA